MQEVSGFHRIDNEIERLEQEIAKLSSTMIVLVEIKGNMLEVTRGNGSVKTCALPQGGYAP